MPRGPRAEKRPGDVEEELASATRNGGLIGAKNRAIGLSAERRSEIARAAARAGWA